MWWWEQRGDQHTLVGAAAVGCRLNVQLGEMQFHPGEEHRHFVHVPPGASWAELRLTAAAHATPKLFLVHTTQILPHTRPQQSRHSLSVTTSSTAAVTFPVAPGASLEVALAQFWKTSRETTLAAELAFHGVAPAGGHVALLGHDHATQVMVRRRRAAAASQQAAAVRDHTCAQSCFIRGCSTALQRQRHAMRHSMQHSLCSDGPRPVHAHR